MEAGTVASGARERDEHRERDDREVADTPEAADVLDGDGRVTSRLLHARRTCKRRTQR
jgi:hypothetical protein